MRRRMMCSKSQYKSSHTTIANQILSLIIQNRPLNHHHLNSKATLTLDSVIHVLRSIPTFFFLSTRSIGCQNTFRHKSPLKQQQPNTQFHYQNPEKIELGLNKAFEFYYWAENQLGFTHTESTCREMAIVLAKSHDLKPLWMFLDDMAKRGVNSLVTTQTITCLIKVLGERGFVNQALALFYRLRKYHCKPDVYAYNTIIFALCRVGFFKKARSLLEQMELPGFRCPADTFTYTIFISSYCKYSLQTGCRKAIRRRLWEANHLFRIMLFKGFVPDVVTYNCLIDGCCKTYRIGRALELFEDMGKRGCVPNRVTYDSFIRYHCAVNEIDKAVEMLRTMQKFNHGTPTSSSYTPIIHALCEVGRVIEARDFLLELSDGGTIPREFTYKLVCDALKSIEHADLLDDALRVRIQKGIKDRYKRVMNVKPIMKQE